MPPIITVSQLSVGFRGPQLLSNVDCQIEAGQRIGLLGRNGAGKTTFMRILGGLIEPDAGQVMFAPQVRAAVLPQEVPQDMTGSIAEIVRAGRAVLEDGDESQAWKHDHAVEQILSRMQLEGDDRFELLSSGMKRRVLLARSIVTSPDLLLLDEPTNHLDLEAINWLEEFLIRWPGTLMFVTHDRMFLRRIATRILEIDRGRLFDWSCDYDTFLKRKESALEAEEKQNALFDKKLAQEEAWIRQGIKARRTRNEGRVRALKSLREERAQRRKDVGKVNLRIEQGQRSGVLVAEVKHLSFAYEGVQIVRDFSTTIERGDRVGLIGPNGAGKTTLLRLLLGKLQPQEGTVRMGSNLQIAYFDQLRDQLNEDETVQENIGAGSDTLEFGGKTKHVLGYLQDFLFSPERARTPIRYLSGGERNRILLARLFSKPANVIVLDEPTNDLDAETLELLEERLMEYEGTLLVVSHDREFLNNVVTSTVSFEDGNVKEYIGGYDDWARQRAEAVKTRQETERQTAQAAKKTAKVNRVSGPVETATRKLSFKEKKELAGLPQAIETLEGQIAQLHAAMANGEFYQQPRDQIAAEQARLADCEAQLTNAYERWEELSAAESS